MNRRIFDLAKKMIAVGVPDNDCIIFVNVYRMAIGIADDLNGCLLSIRGREVLQHEYDSLCNYLDHLFHFNEAVRRFKSSVSF